MATKKYKETVASVVAVAVGAYLLGKAAKNKPLSEEGVMGVKTTIGDFWATKWGNYQYKIVYQSPATGRIWAWLTNDEEWYDIVMQRESHTKKQLESLKWNIKNYGWESDYSEYRR